MNTFLEQLKTRIANNPRGLFVLVYTEMWELFGRFGITALLVIYLTHTLHVDDAIAFAAYSGFMALTYVTPLLGGFLADKMFGMRVSILIGGIIMTLGNCVLVIPQLHMVYIGLATVAVGSGFFTPALAASVGRLYDNHPGSRDSGFVLYYVAKNIGALLAPIACGIVAVNFGYNFAFSLSALGMLTGIIVFLIGQNRLQVAFDTVKEQVAEKPSLLARLKHGFLAKVVTVLLTVAILIPSITSVLEYHLDGKLLIISGIVAAIIIASIVIKRAQNQRNAIYLIVLAGLCAVIFSAFLGQGGTTLNLFVERIINRHLFDFTIPPTVFYALDPIFMILFGPFVMSMVRKIHKPNYESAAFTKFALGIAILALGFSVFVIAAYFARFSGQASPLYVLLAYSIFPVAELFIMPIAIAMITRIAPDDLKAMMVGIYMLGLASASYFTGVISDYGQVNFSTQHLLGRQHAALIYEHVFAGTAIILALVAMTIMLIKFVLPALRQK